MSKTFKYFFGKQWPPTKDLPSHLTPGDFAVVQKKSKILNIQDPITLANMLEDEIVVKNEDVKRIGFNG